MATVIFTANIQRLVVCPQTQAEGETVRAVLDNVFRQLPQARNYILDDQSALRKHIAIFIGKKLIRDRTGLSDPVSPSQTIYVMQALSGG